LIHLHLLVTQVHYQIALYMFQILEIVVNVFRDTRSTDQLDFVINALRALLWILQDRVWKVQLQIVYNLILRHYAKLVKPDMCKYLEHALSVPLETAK